MFCLVDEHSDVRICNDKQNLKGPYIVIYKNSLQDVFLFMKATGFSYTLAWIYTTISIINITAEPRHQNYIILWISKF